MANNFVANPITIDTVQAAAYPPGAGYVYIRDLTWTDMAATDALVIVDRNGNIIVDTKASAAGVIERFGHVGEVNGFRVTTLTAGGKVMIYIR